MPNKLLYLAEIIKLNDNYGPGLNSEGRIESTHKVIRNVYSLPIADLHKLQLYALK